MCGIIGGCSQRDISPILLAGLAHLEYRGYDSAGMAVITDEQLLTRYRAMGKVAALAKLLESKPLSGKVGIAHTRWATHGEPSERNAHPHLSGQDVAVVHNGIIENHALLRDKLTALHYQFESETDTEIVAHLLHHALAQGLDYLNAVKFVVDQLEGAFALVFLYAQEPECLIAVRKGSPLVIGCGIGENFVASDTLALMPVTQQFMFMEENDIALIRRDQVRVYDQHLKSVTREIQKGKGGAEVVSRGEYRHFMLKEIHEQASAVKATFSRFVSGNKLNLNAFSPELLAILKKTRRIQIVACGTSYHAGLVAKSWFESEAKISTQVEVASEWRYRDVLVEPDTLFIGISQSGETADTLAALRMAKTRSYMASLGICNVAESSLVRESDVSLLTEAGREIGVASTKAFTTQLIVLYLLMIVMGRQRALSEAQEKACVEGLLALPALIDSILSESDKIEGLAQAFVSNAHALFLARSLHYPIALEGALKLKELSYIHAEAYPAGELKHGPLALIDKNMPIVALAPADGLIDKLKSNLQEVKARGGQLFVLTDSRHEKKLECEATVIVLPDVFPLLSPVLYTLPLQLLAYYVAVHKGTDVDQPRHLAKSVTVE